jgi:predicted HAD superfamily Cof-like phosphohydrolase
MNKTIKQVMEFHKTFVSPIKKVPQIPKVEISDLRIRLLQEELDELKDSIINNNIVESLDALCDLLYILNGTIIEFGMAEIFDISFDDVHRSNMTKACSSEKEALETLLFYKKKDGTEGYYKETNGKYLVYRSSDNKVLKSVNYSPADILTILNK